MNAPTAKHAPIMARLILGLVAVAASARKWMDGSLTKFCAPSNLCARSGHLSTAKEARRDRIAAMILEEAAKIRAKQ